MLRRSISFSVADLTSGKATHRIARQARLGYVLARRRIEATSRSGRSRAARSRQEPDWTHIPHVPAGDVGADHNHGALRANRQQSTCHKRNGPAAYSPEHYFCNNIGAKRTKPHRFSPARPWVRRLVRRRRVETWRWPGPNASPDTHRCSDTVHTS